MAFCFNNALGIGWQSLQSKIVILKGHIQIRAIIILLIHSLNVFKHSILQFIQLDQKIFLHSTQKHWFPQNLEP